jgi:hypothetical protein
MARTFRNPVAKFMNQSNRPSTEEDRSKFRRNQRKAAREQAELAEGWTEFYAPTNQTEQ